MEVTTKDLTEPLHEQAGPACELSGAELIRRHGLFAPTAVITMTLYTAARHDGCDFNSDDFAGLAR